MDAETKNLAHSLSDGKALIIGDKAYYPPLTVGEKSVHLDGFQIRFLSALSTYEGNLEKACNAVGKTLEWANQFLASPKFKKFLRIKLALASARNGDLADFWWQMGVDGMKGYREFYSGVCAGCLAQTRLTAQEAAMLEGDDLTIKAVCDSCNQPISLTRSIEPFKPTREQVQFWDGLGNRLVPKVERVQHEFSSESFRFVTDDNSNDIAS